MPSHDVLLAAAGREFAAYWISAPLYAPQAVRAALDLPDGWVPQAFIALGHPDPSYQASSRPTPELARHLVRR